jgi:hypothetical protein
MKLSFMLLASLLSQVVPVQGQDLVWARQMGGSHKNNEGFSVAVDGSGNVYTTGFFEGTVDFDPGLGVFNLTGADDAGLDVFVSKLDSAGNFVWARRMGGTDWIWDWARGRGVAVDGGGNVYTTGEFRGTVDFDPGAGVFNLTSTGGQNFDADPDIFVSKLDSAGNFVWARRMGAGGRDVGRSVAVDGSGNVYTTGVFRGTVDFDPGAGVFNLPDISGGFVSKLDTAGNFVWARQLGGVVEGVAVDGSGNVYTAGFFRGTVDFDPGAGVFNLTSANLHGEIFVSKLDSAGNFVWAGQMGGRAGWLAATSMAWLWTATAMSTRRGLSAIPSTSTPAPASST